MIRDDFMALAAELDIRTFEETEDGAAVLYFNIDGEHGMYLASAMFMEEEHLFVCTVNLGMKISEEKLAAAAIHFMERNYSYIFASMYIDTGSRFAVTRCPMVIRGDEDERRNLIRAAMYQASAMADAEYRGIAAFV